MKTHMATVLSVVYAKKNSKEISCGWQGVTHSSQPLLTTYY